MSRSIYISTNCFQDRSPQAILDLCKKESYQAIELSQVHADETQAIALARSLYTNGVDVILHNYYPPSPEPFTINLASQNISILEYSRSFCRRALELSAEVQAPFYAAHAGYTLDLHPALLGDPDAQAQLSDDAFWSRQKCLNTFSESVLQLSEYGHRLGVEFLIENHVLSSSNSKIGKQLLLCWEAGEIEELARRLDGGLKLLLDFGHLKVSAQSAGFCRTTFVKQVRPCLRALHLSENDGMNDDNALFKEDAWFLPILSNLKDDLPCTLEFNRVATHEIARARGILEQ